MLEREPLANVLYIDLSRKRYWVERREDLFARFLGGVGVATQLLLEECPPDADPLGPENPIIFAVGPLTGLFPLASKTVAMFKSPHNGLLGESHAGGRSAIALRMAGYGAIVIKGANETPGYIAIHGDKVYFRDAATLWGMKSSFTVGRVIREKEPSSGLRTIMRIGPAGEKLVSYACVTVDTYRHFGRLGLGAVFGAKKLKAVVIAGKRSLPAEDMAAYRKLYQDIYQQAVASPVMKKYHDLGTAQNVLPLNIIGGLPTRNLQAGKFEAAEKISGERFAHAYLGRRLACSHCPVGCVHIAALRRPYGDEPYFYKTTMTSYDYELIYALGSMLGGFDAEELLSLIELVEALGLDAMSTGVVLAWATEALERGLITTKDTLGVKLRWGNYSAYRQAVQFIVDQPGDFYRALARGVTYAASVYGGEDFALAYGGNEMPGYHTGPGAHLGYLVGARHSHLDNAGYSFDQDWLTGKGSNPSPQELVNNLLAEEYWRQIMASLVICFFARGIYRPQTVIEALQVTGREFAEEELRRLGEMIYREKCRFKIKAGFSPAHLRFPARIFSTPAAAGVIEPGYLQEAVAYLERILFAGEEEGYQEGN